MKIALVYDRVNSWGGAERVLLLLHRMFPDAPLYTSVYNAHTAGWAKEIAIHASVLSRIPFLRSRHQWLAPFMPMIFESFDFSGYDVVISVTSEAAKGVIVRPPTRHLCICLTPTRYLWSGHSFYFPRWLSILLYPLIGYLRAWDWLAAQRPQMIGISQEVVKRIKRYYQKDAALLYPAIPPARTTSKTSPESEPYFLVVSRLSPFTRYKRVDLAVRAAETLSLRLVIIGPGNASFLQIKKHNHVIIKGAVDEQTLADYYAHAEGLIFAGEEDFGLVMAEALSYGTPVIAYGKGGALEIVEDRKTGRLFKTQSIDALVDVLKDYRKSDYNKAYCIRSARRFSEERYIQTLESYLRRCMS